MAQPREWVPLAPYTSIDLGGRARYFLEVQDGEQLRDALRWADEEGLPVQVLGGGSNTIFADAGFSGLVLRVGFKGTSYREQRGDVLATAQAGETWDDFVEAAVARGFGGLECLSGIPGSVGATPIQNVGAYGQEVAQTIEAIDGLDRRNLRIVRFRNEECGFRYRWSRFKGEDAGRYVITAVHFRLRGNALPTLRYPEIARLAQTEGVSRLAPAQQLLAVRRIVLFVRRGKSMLLDPADPNSRSVGSFFLNPILTKGEFEAFTARLAARWPEEPPDPPVFPAPNGGRKLSAGWLIEHAGFRRGYGRGGARISENHVLALVNRGATTEEILGLAGEIENQVFRVFGVRLKREPVVVPADLRTDAIADGPRPD